MLSCYRILDLTDERGDLAGFLLAQLGAEVVAVEPPGGQGRRHQGPFAEEVAGPERSLGHWAYNRGKQSVVVHTVDELAILAAGADVLIECGAAHLGADIGLDLAALRAANPSLITVSLSPFGGDGPKAGWAGTDLTLDAASGQLALTGDSDRPPVRISAPQVWANAAAEATAGIVCALYERGRSGLGQHLDVSAQEAMMLTAQSWTAPALVGRPSVGRVAGGAILIGARFRFVYQALDGHITLGILPGVMTGPFVNRLLAVMAETGECPPELVAENWIDLAARLPADVMAPLVERTCDAVAAFVAKRTKADLFVLSLERHLLVMPLHTPSDVLASPQLADRRFWDELAAADLGLSGDRPTIRVPGPFALAAERPLHRLARPPRLGEHTDHLLGPAGRRTPNLGGPAPTRREAPGVAATGVAAAGEAAAGVAAAGEVVTGVVATGEAATSLMAAGVEASGMAAASMEASGMAVTGEAVTGEAVTGEAAAGMAVTGVVAAGMAATGEAAAGVAAGMAVTGEAVTGEATAGEAAAGMAAAGMATARRATAGVAVTEGSPVVGALDGVRVLDLTWVYAGPFATRWLAYEGAEVIRVESTARPDQVRGAGIPYDGKGGPEDSVGWHNVNADKLSLQLNLSVPAARQVVIDLARHCDVMIESLAPGVMARLGLGPEQMRAVNDQLIYVSTSLFGQSGPLSRVPGFGNMGAAAGGFYALTGWPDRLPAGPYLAYTDATSPRLTIAAMVAALDWRRRSGRGVTIDFSQIEGGIHFLSPAVLAAEVNGVDLVRMGNADPEMVPHGVYPAAPAGADRWVALACRHDADWRVLCDWMGRPDLADLDRDGRRAREAELDAAVAGWTAGQDPAAFEQEGQRRGLAVHQVQNSPECITDPQLTHRQHYVSVAHGEYGSSWAEQFGVRASRTGRLPRRAGPCWGEHNDYVLSTILGYDDERITDLVIAGAIE